MPRHPPIPTTVLGAAVQKEELAHELGISRPTLSRVERGSHAPSVTTAIALARWLGWTLEAVVEAAATPVPSQDAG